MIIRLVCFKVIFQVFYFKWMIDASTDEKETYASVLFRSIQLARCFRRFGLQPGDVLALGGKNHLDLFIPYYAGLLNGLPILGVDTFFKYAEIKTLISQTKPKIVFCQRENYDIYLKTTLELELTTKIVTFDEGECSLAKFIEKYSEETEDEFKPADFDTDKVFAWLTCTSGTTGTPKVAAIKHHTILGCLEMLRSANMPQEGMKTIHLHVSPVQWLSSFHYAMLVLHNSCKVQTPSSLTTEHVIHIINKYKPTSTLINPVILRNIINSENPCDLTCFNTIIIGGTKMYKDDVVALKARLHKDARIIESYGQTETLGPALIYTPNGPLGSCGVCVKDICDVKLVDLETEEEITQPNVPGELYCKPKFMFSEYYNNQGETENAFSADGWYKSGDVLYRDADNNYYFVERIKSFIKFMGIHIYPGELEKVIQTLNGVEDVCVTSVPYEKDWQIPVACVVRRPGSTVSAQDIKNVIAETLSDSKQLRGGVVFMDELPLTSTGKVARMKLKQIVMDMQRE